MTAANDILQDWFVNAGKPQNNFRRPASTFDLSLVQISYVGKPNLRQPPPHSLSWDEKLTARSSCRLWML